MNIWHQSWIEDMVDCPERFRRNRAADKAGEHYNTAAAMMGTAVHFAMAANLVQLRDYGLMEAQGIVGEVAKANFQHLAAQDAETTDPIPWTEGSFNERVDEVDVMAMGIWDRVPSILEAYGAPLSVEHQFNAVPLVFDIGLTGTWDLLTDRHVLIDWKTSRSGWRPGEEHKKIQPAVYGRAVEHVTGRRPELFIYVIVSRTGKVSVREVPLHEGKFSFLEEQIPRLERMRRNGIYPMNPGSLLCSDVWCPWFTRGCPAGRFKTAA